MMRQYKHHCWICRRTELEIREILVRERAGLTEELCGRAQVLMGCFDREERTAYGFDPLICPICDQIIQGIINDS